MYNRIQVTLFALLVLLASSPAFSESARPDLIVPVSVAPSPATFKSLDSVLYAYHVFEVPLSQVNEQVRTLGRLRLLLGGQIFDLALSSNNLLGEGYRAVLMQTDGVPVEIEPPRIDTFQGHVVGDPSSIVRLTISPERLEGYVWTEESWVFIESLSRYERSANPSRLVVYRDGDTRSSRGFRCGVAERHSLSADLSSDWSSIKGAMAKRAERTLEIATDADGEFIELYGLAEGFSRIRTLVNMVDGIYQRELNLRLKISFQNGWADPETDPYSGEPANQRLGQFRSYWNLNYDWVERGTAHLFSGAPLNRGLAIPGGTICNPFQSYSIFPYIFEEVTLFEVLGLAHEITHGFGFGHDNGPICTCGAQCISCASGTYQPIMCGDPYGPSIDEFSECTKDAVSTYVNSAENDCFL